MGLRQRGQDADVQGEVEESNETKDGKSNQEVADDECKTKDCRHEHHPHCRRFLASPLWRCITLVLVGFTPVFGMLLAFPHLLAALAVQPGSRAYWLHYIFGSWLSIQFIYNFAATQWTDPGNCKSIKPTQEVTGQFELGGDVGLSYAPNWCTKCSNWKPPRSHHCSTCGRCILRMDHHCPFTGTCIGARNHGHFVLFYIFAIVGLTYSLVLSMPAAYATDHISRWQDLILPKYKEHQEWVGKHFHAGLVGVAFAIIMEVMRRKGFEITVQLMASFLAMIPVMGTGFPAWQLAWTNTTTMERLFPMKEYVQLKDQVYCPLGPGFYRHSGLTNLKMILGKRWWLRLFLPLPGQLDMSLFLAPPPSRIGSEALAQRLEQVKENGVKQEVKNCQELGFDPGPRPQQAV